MLLHRREDAEVALDASVVVVTDIVFNHIDQLFFRGKALDVVPFPLQNAPKAFHRAVVNALSHTRHALLHAGFLQFVMEGAIGILKAPITMKQRMSVRIGFHGPVKGLKNQGIVIPVTYDMGNNTTVIEIQDRAEIDLVYLEALIPFELCNIGKPLLIWLVRVEVSVKKILSYILWVLCPSCAAVVIVLDGGLDALSPADAENALVVHMNMFVVTQVVVDTSVAFIRALHVDLLDLLRKLLILRIPGTQFPGCPTKIGGAGNVKQFTGCLNRIVLLCMAFPYSSVQMRLPHL